MEEIVLNDLQLFKFSNPSEHPKQFSRILNSLLLQFHFSLKGETVFGFNEGRYQINLPNEETLLLYNPQQQLPINIQLKANSKLLSVLMPINTFHGFFSDEADYIHFLSEDKRDKKYYSQTPTSPALTVVLNQIFNNKMHPSVNKLYVRGKVYELLSLYFNRAPDADTEQCPFLENEDTVQRIKEAKDIIIARMAQPPGLKELAEETGLNIRKLKEGFKQIYGDSVYHFLFDYKMDYARKMLETGNYNVNEVALKVGYSTASHFITAFKKKYGTTPKKYLKNRLSAFH